MMLYILLQACRHLDNVHSVFGRVVGGAATTLARMEEAEVDKVSKGLAGRQTL